MLETWNRDHLHYSQCSKSFSPVYQAELVMCLQVYKGRFRGQDCAVKFLIDGSEQARAWFLREIKLLGKLQSEHITKCLGWCTCVESLVLLMELMPGTFTAAIQLCIQSRYVHQWCFASMPFAHGLMVLHWLIYRHLVHLQV